jgi:signal peptidase I
MEEREFSIEQPSEGQSVPAEPEPVKPRRKTLIWTSFGGFLIFLLAFSIFFYKNFRTIEVQGDSMEPTLTEGERLLVSSAYWLVGEIKDNDIVVIRNRDEGDTIIKRVYKREGETVDLANVPDSWDITQGKYVVPPGTIYVLGDNREVSQDSRHHGPFELKDVLGKVVIVQSTVGSDEP